MHIITATFRIVTPMFLGDSESTVLADTIRPPSLKGALRFWWRALQWGRLVDESQGDTAAALRQLKREEDALFGSSEGGQSQLLMRIVKKDGLLRTHDKHTSLKYSDGKTVVGPGSRYLGYGVVEAAGRLTRGCIEADQDFTVEIRSRRPIPGSIADALKVFGLLGGIGSKARKGYGSITLETLSGEGISDWEPPANRQAFTDTLLSLLGDTTKTCELPEYSTFSQHTRIELVDSGDAALKLLNEVGETMQMYRSWGKDKKVNGQPAEQNFKDDHDLARDAADGKTVPDHPQRVVFGLPHNYFFSSDKKKVDVGIAPRGKEKLDRRASPLFIHIHAYSQDSYEAVISILPARFLPSDMEVQVGKSRVPQKISYKFLNEFLDGMRGESGKKTTKPYFPNRTTVFPKAAA